ncbi:dual specificity phosphatase [Colletotrichum orchidophilum]|uniref:protein-tyrosine-phosphatase n=1 Tax=Colletotrichum orchidophilum TaxID=1209926 RepID=A0A1G4AST2_9PEZI|nr:dual specificity phosphatase [Colletotrichum orchidophilum]OHE92175.1 dual specificity phosphatase [Colletotrichum orchidophilum]
MVRGQVSTEDVTKRLKEIESSLTTTTTTTAGLQDAAHVVTHAARQAPTNTLEVYTGEPEGSEETEALHRLLKQSCVEMAMNRIDGDEELFVGGIWALRRPSALKGRNITHILSVLRFDPAGLKSETDTWENYGKSYKHMVIDVDDVEDEDLLVHLPKAVRFIEDALYPGSSKTSVVDWPEEEAQKDKSFQEKAKRLKAAVVNDLETESDSEKETASAAAATKPTDPDAITPVPLFQDLNLGSNGERPDSDTPGAVYVHCAMGKSRSVSVVVAYLLWKHPSRFGRSATSTAAAQKGTSVGGASKPADEAAAAQERASAAVAAAVKWVRNTREIAEPNLGFIRQLEMWWAMGCPEDVASHPIYKRWEFRREIDESLAAGQAPSRLRFEDEETSKEEAESVRGMEVRCKKCRKTLATPRFVLDHEPDTSRGRPQQQQPCGHVFVEPLGWMREELEKGTLEGRLSCPNQKCGAAVGRYSWRGFRCSCGGWVTPGFSLQKGRVDEVAARVPGAGGAAGMASMGIRMPPGSGRL